MKTLTKDNLSFLSTLTDDECLQKGFIASMILDKKEALSFIRSQLPTKDDLHKQTIKCYADRTILYSEGDYDEICEVNEVFFGSRMWYLELNSEGFRWIGNSCYGVDEWDNDSIIKISWTNFDALDYVARALYKDFKNSGNLTDNWNKISQ